MLWKQKVPKPETSSRSGMALWLRRSACNRSKVRENAVAVAGAWEVGSQSRWWCLDPVGLHKPL